jgi:hypothetical protein
LTPGSLRLESIHDSLRLSVTDLLGHGAGEISAEVALEYARWRRT